MEYKDLDLLVDKKIKEIFKDVDYNDLSIYDRRLYIYDYLTDNVNYDYKLLCLKINKKSSNDNFQEVVDVFEKQTGVCNGITQAYKLLLEKVNVEVGAIVGKANNIPHQLALVKNNDNWSFDDPARGAMNKNEKWNYYDYDYEYATQIKQQEDGILPEMIYDLFFNRESKENNLFERKKGKPYYEMPDNIRSSKIEDPIYTARHM
ncbi:MAG: hypothetical protein PHQ89_03135 [Bacilli bacterium]|nr:hypothetical protein [Bacilli bacterium]